MSKSICRYCGSDSDDTAVIPGFKGRSLVWKCGTVMIAGPDAQNFSQSKECKSRAQYNYDHGPHGDATTPGFIRQGPLQVPEPPEENV